MDLLDKVLLEWSARTDKGYPDLNNEQDLAIFESMFGFSLKEEITRKNSIAAAQDFANSSAAKRLGIFKFKSGKYANRLNSTQEKDLNAIRKLLQQHFNLKDNDIIFHSKGEGLASKDSVPGFQLNTEKYGEIYIAVSTGKKGTGGLGAEATLANQINTFTKGIESIKIIFTDGKTNAVVEDVLSAERVGNRQEVKGAKADVALYSTAGKSGKPVGNISVKKDGRTESEFRWASVNNNDTPFRKSFVDKALSDTSFPIELKRTGHHLDTDKSPKYQMFKRGTDERITLAVVEEAPTDANEEYLFGTDDPKTIIVTRSFEPKHFEFNDDTKTLTVDCTAVYTDIDQIQDSAVEPVFVVMQHQKQTYGLDFRIVPKGMAEYGPRAKGITINYSDVI